MVSDENFVCAIRELNRSGTPYWLTSGTLLGIVRDDDLISWDGDIDIAVHRHDFRVWQCGRALHRAGFHLGYTDGATSFHFYRSGGRKVDVNVVSELQRQGRLVGATVWRDEEALPRLYRTLRNWAIATAVKRINAAIAQDRRSHLFVSVCLLYLRAVVVVGGAAFHPKRFGYFVPMELLREFVMEDVSGLEVRVPLAKEAVLEALYGAGWRTPHRSRRWTEFTEFL